MGSVLDARIAGAMLPAMAVAMMTAAARVEGQRLGAGNAE